MGFGLAGGVVAANILIILTGCMVGYRMLLMYAAPLDDEKARALDRLPLTILLVLVLAMAESGYYAAARWLQPMGVNLWRAYPAPFVIALGEALAIYWHMPTYFAWRGLARAATLRRIALEVAALIIIWGVLFGVLH